MNGAPSCSKYSITDTTLGWLSAPADAGLLQEAPGERGVGGVGGVQLLERDLAIERGLAGEMDGRHAAAAELAHDLVAADDTGWVRRHVPGNARPRALFRAR